MGQMAATFFFQLQGANSAEASNPSKSFDQASADSPIFGAVLSASLDNSNTPFAELTPEKLPQTLQELQEEFQGQFKLVSLKKGDVKIDEEGNVFIPKRILNAIEKGEFSEPGNFSTQLSSNAEKTKNTDDMVSISVVSKGKVQQFIKHLNQEAENSSEKSHANVINNLFLLNSGRSSSHEMEDGVDFSNAEKPNSKNHALIKELKSILEKAGSSEDVKALLQTLKEIAQSTESRDFMKALQEFSEKHNIDLSTVFRNATKTESDNKRFEKKDTQTDSTSSLRSKIQDILTSSKNAPLNSHEKTQISKQEGTEEREKVVSTKNHGELVEGRKINGDLHEKSRDAQTQISKSSLKEVDIANQTDTSEKDNPLNKIKDGLKKPELAENTDNDKKDSIKQTAEPAKDGEGSKVRFERKNFETPSGHKIENTEKNAAIFDETILKTDKGRTHPTNSDQEEQNQEQVSIKRPFLTKEQILAGEKTTNKDAGNEKPLGSLSPQAEEVTPNVERKENEKKDHDSQAVKGDRQDIDSHTESIATQDRENGQEKTGLPPNILGIVQQLILAYQKVENPEAEKTSGINKDEFLEKNTHSFNAKIDEQEPIAPTQVKTSPPHPEMIVENEGSKNSSQNAENGAPRVFDIVKQMDREGKLEAFIQEISSKPLSEQEIAKILETYVSKESLETAKQIKNKEDRQVEIQTRPISAGENGQKSESSNPPLFAYVVVEDNTDEKQAKPDNVIEIRPKTSERSLSQSLPVKENGAEEIDEKRSEDSRPTTTRERAAAEMKDEITLKQNRNGLDIEPLDKINQQTQEKEAVLAFKKGAEGPAVHQAFTRRELDPVQHKIEPSAFTREVHFAENGTGSEIKTAENRAGENTQPQKQPSAARFVKFSSSREEFDSPQIQKFVQSRSEPITKQNVAETVIDQKTAEKIDRAFRKMESTFKSEPSAEKANLKPDSSKNLSPQNADTQKAEKQEANPFSRRAREIKEALQSSTARVDRTEEQKGSPFLPAKKSLVDKQTAIDSKNQEPNPSPRPKEAKESGISKTERANREIVRERNSTVMEMKDLPRQSKLETVDIENKRMERPRFEPLPQTQAERQTDELTKPVKDKQFLLYKVHEDDLPKSMAERNEKLVMVKSVPQTEPLRSSSSEHTLKSLETMQKMEQARNISNGMQVVEPPKPDMAKEKKAKPSSKPSDESKEQNQQKSAANPIRSTSGMQKESFQDSGQNGDSGTESRPKSPQEPIQSQNQPAANYERVASAAQSAPEAKPPSGMGQQAQMNPTSSQANPEPAQTSSSQQAVDKILQMQESVSRQVVRQVQGSLGNERSFISLRLVPQSLGTLNIQLKMENGKLSAHLMAEKESTRALIEKSIATLRKAFDEGGIKVERIAVSRESGEVKASDNNKSDNNSNRFSRSRDETASNSNRDQSNRRKQQNEWKEWREQFSTQDYFF